MCRAAAICIGLQSLSFPNGCMKMFSRGREVDISGKSERREGCCVCEWRVCVCVWGSKRCVPFTSQIVSQSSITPSCHHPVCPLHAEHMLPVHFNGESHLLPHCFKDQLHHSMCVYMRACVFINLWYLYA